MSQDEEHDRLCCETKDGRAAWELRQAAHAAAQQGAIASAISLLQQAVAKFEGQPDSVGRAAAQHDLAKALLDVGPFDPFARSAALDLLERAVESAARRQFPGRWAISASLLATTLRHLASEIPEPIRAALMFDRAEGLFVAAIKAADSAYAWHDLPGYWLNLGNLCIKRDDEDGAIKAFERGHAQAQPFAERFRDVIGLAFDRLSANLGRLLLRRGHPGDRERGQAMLQGVARSPGPDGALARLDLVRLHDRDGEHGKACDLMRSIGFIGLNWDGLAAALGTCLQLGLIEHAISQLHELLDMHFCQRVDTIADLDADRATRDLQSVAALLAHVYLDVDRPLEAFLTRENVAGLRFNERTSANLASHLDPVTRALQVEFARAGATAAMLDDLLGRVVVTPPDSWRATLERSATAYESQPPDLAPWAPAAAAALRLALAQQPVALEPIDAAIVQAFERAARAQERLADRASEDGHRVNQDVSHGELRRVLREHPGAVLLQVATGNDHLSAIGVRLVDDQLVTRPVTVPLPPRLFAALAEVEAKTPTPELALELTTLLEGIDLSPALVGGHHAVAVLLPSSAAARLPLAAVGPPGKRLLDRCDAVIWLPNLFALRTRQAARPPRVGRLAVVPGLHGETRWHQVAFAESLPAEERLTGRSATRAAVLRAAAEADVVTFYGHGSHVDGAQSLAKDREFGASIQLADEPLTIFDLDSRWRAMERVELWGCQTGVHTNIDPMAAPTDDAFGLDFEFMRFGARSAIGSLYKVPEVLTAFLVADYRRRLRGGAAADRALADAQRAWVSERLPALLTFFREDPTTALERLAARHDVTLGPRDPKGVDVDAYDAIWSCPAFWASFRFVGVADRRPIEPWDPAAERPLTEAELQQIDDWVEGDPSETATPERG